METHSRILRIEDAVVASTLDKQWYGEYGISTQELTQFVVNHPQCHLGLFINDTLEGFTTFEILENQVPKDYVGIPENQGRVMFIQQFTTSASYLIANAATDALLLTAVESTAKKLCCDEVWEALSVNHPYMKEINSSFDVFGFYQAHGYQLNTLQQLQWRPNSETSIDCVLIRKKLE